MEPLPGCNIKYLNISRNDEAWGLVVTTAGYQAVAAHSSYPQAQHPESHIFDPGKGRVLKGTSWSTYRAGRAISSPVRAAASGSGPGR